MGPFDQAAAIKIDQVEIGCYGKIPPQIAAGYEIDQPVFFFLFDYEALLKNRSKNKHFQDFSRFPAVKRDLSLIFDETVAAETITDALRASGGSLLKSSGFFDLYRGKQLEAGKKSLSITLRLQASDRTLTDAETDAIIDNIVTALKNLGGLLRQS